MLRTRRQELGLSLRQIEQRAAAEGNPIPFSTLSKIEQAKTEPGLRRLVQLLRLYHLPVELAGELLEVEELAGEVPVEGEDPTALLQEAVDCVKRGDLRRGLAKLLALRLDTADDPDYRLLRQSSTLTLAIACISLGKVKLARRLAEDLLIEGPDPSLLVNVLAFVGRAWRELGVYEGALAFVERAAHHVDDDHPQHRAWVCHELALIHRGKGELDEALRLIDEALEHYRRAEDVRGEAPAIGAKVSILERRGEARAALRLARAGLALAEKHGFENLRLHRMLDEGRLQLALGDREAGLAVLHEALGESIKIGNKDAQFHAHYQLWKAYDGFGDKERARFEEQAACYFVRFVDEVNEASTEVRQKLGEGLR
ncbi:MAG: helix-turn-helix domain-containing protein [Acidobacteriota bacterium]|nr:MAG: helix-turn-helix domain-containing protein [Acidobacteriota bacterium]